MSSQEEQDQLFESLRLIFEDVNNAPPGKEYCEECGSLLVQVGTHFWLDGFDRSWNIVLPYCRNCNPEIGGGEIFDA